MTHPKPFSNHTLTLYGYSVCRVKFERAKRVQIPLSPPFLCHLHLKINKKKRKTTHRMYGWFVWQISFFACLQKKPRAGDFARGLRSWWCHLSVRGFPLLQRARAAFRARSRRASASSASCALFRLFRTAAIFAALFDRPPFWPPSFPRTAAASLMPLTLSPWRRPRTGSRRSLF